jgi:Bacterial archaeo-eukaryotic release factor family 7
MELLSRAEFEKLIKEPEGLCVSIFLPTHWAGTQTRQDPIRLKNLLREAEEQLLAKGLRLPEADELLAPARELLDDSVFWQHQSDGLAVFLSPGVFRYYRLPLNFGDLVIVADRYYLRPLLPLLTGDGQFYVLALSQNKVRLLQGTRHSVSEVELEDVPKSLADTLRYDDQEKQLQFHTGTTGGRGGEAAIFHGHERDDPKDDILRYFRQIDRGVQELLKGSQAPLVLAGVDYLLPIYKEASSYPHTIDEGIIGNPEKVGSEELHERAWDAVRPRFSEAQQKAAARYRQLAGTGQTSKDIREIVAAASYGRIETLFAASGIHRWGVFDPATGRVELHEGPEGEDLLEFAAIQTVLHQGTVYVTSPENMPENAEAVSIFRY